MAERERLPFPQSYPAKGEPAFADLTDGERFARIARVFPCLRELVDELATRPGGFTVPRLVDLAFGRGRGVQAAAFVVGNLYDGGRYPLDLRVVLASLDGDNLAALFAVLGDAQPKAFGLAFADMTSAAVARAGRVFLDRLAAGRAVDRPGMSEPAPASDAPPGTLDGNRPPR